MGNQLFNGFAPADPVDDRLTVIAVHGAFHGSVMQPAAIEGMIAAHIPKAHFSEVADVYTTKWWDYRRLAPGHSFMLFVESYYKAFRIAAKRMLTQRSRNQRDLARFGPGDIQFTAEGIWERDKSHITSLWNAMLVADAIGIPYNEYFKLANRAAFDTAWARVPRPNQLYSSAIMGQVADDWVSLSKERLLAAKHPVFLIENFVGTELQINYRGWLIDEIKQVKNPIPALALTIYQRPQLPESDAAAHFSDITLQRAKSLA